MTSEQKPQFDWLNEDFLKNVLQNHHKCSLKEIQIKSFDVSYAAAKGDNYLGTVMRVKVKFCRGSNELISCYVIKTTDGDVVDGSSELANETNAYPKEMEMYEIILPSLEIMWHHVGEKAHFAPR